MNHICPGCNKYEYCEQKNNFKKVLSCVAFEERVSILPLQIVVGLVVTAIAFAVVTMAGVIG